MPIEYDASRDALFKPESRETLFESGVQYSTVQLAAEAARLAYLRAEADPSDYAHLTESLSRVGFGVPDLIFDQATNTYAFLSKGDSGATLLSFRGTQPDSAVNIATDLRASTVPWPESAGRVHHGFARALRAVRPKIDECLAKSGADRSGLLVTGHSLGAALATLAATIWTPNWLVTLGSPRVGEEEFIKTVRAANKVRLVDCCDVVTQVPPPIAGYMHLRSFTYLTRDAQRLENPGDSLVEEDRRVARAEYLERYAWKMKTVAVRDLADHAPINYLRCLFV
jgi:hypothetical protein